MSAIYFSIVMLLKQSLLSYYKHVFNLFSIGFFLYCPCTPSSSHVFLIFSAFYTAGATLIFSVELVEIQQKPLISIPRGSGFYTFLGVVAVILLIAYEMYKRTRQHSEEIKKQKKAHSSRPQKGKKTKKN